MSSFLKGLKNHYHTLVFIFQIDLGLFLCLAKVEGKTTNLRQNFEISNNAETNEVHTTI